MPASIRVAASHLDPGESGGAGAPDPALAAAVELARSMAEEEAAGTDDPIGSPVLTLPADDDPVGEHVGVEADGPHAATHFFESNYPGYVGWRWAVTVANAGPGTPVTVSEIVLLPGPDALTAPTWVPWQDRVRPGDLGVGDLLPSSPDDPRLAPSVPAGDDPLLRSLGDQLGWGRARVLSPYGRAQAAERWRETEFGPDSEIARLAPGACVTCGFFVPLAGPMGGSFGVCGNEVSPADGRVVHAEYGCGAHSQAEVDTSSTVPVAEVVYDDATLDYEPRPRATVPAEGDFEPES